ncbi:sugar phosphate isomerase/epimerase family protein [Mesorhizobium sp. M0323]|uniref:sugar phosphate isomerase/epimerase family protein n=1 Tax=Mesorhizobium sp. M0323 TaxID=2956938 RepID=UPI003335F086
MTHGTVAALKPERIAINQATTRKQWDFREAVEGYARHGVHWIGAWRDGIDKYGIAEVKRLLADNGMSVTSLNRAGPLVGLDRANRQSALDDARRALDQAAEISAGCLPVLPGSLPPGSKDLSGVRTQYQDMLAELLVPARKAGVPLALEPLHPMVAADRSCMNTMTDANDLCDALGPGIGILLDVYQVWWDTRLEAEIMRTGKDRGRLLGFHVSDWLVPTRDMVFDRGMMGDGVIDLRLIRGWVEAAGYDGPVEIEIFSSLDWWTRNPEDVVKISLERCRTVV